MILLEDTMSEDPESTALAIPDHQTCSLPQLVAICEQVFTNRDEIIGKWPLRQALDYANGYKAIEKYLRKREQKDSALRAARVFETAVGAALGPAPELGTVNQHTALPCEVKHQDRHRFRLMNEYRSVWEPELEKRGLPRAEVMRIIDAHRRSENPEPEKTGTVEDLEELATRDLKFGTIYADPPWLYSNQGTRAATSNHYDGMTVEELCALPISDLAAEDAHLHLWITNAFLFDAPKIFECWDFEFRSSYIWIKPQMGIGNYWRNSHEILLTAIRGNAKRFNDKNLMSWGQFDRTRHSAKPESIRMMLERASPGPRLELFGRSEVEGWVVWGNEISKNLFVQAEKL